MLRQHPAVAHLFLVRRPTLHRCHRVAQLSVWQGSPAWLARYSSSAVTCCSTATSEQALLFTKAWSVWFAKHLWHVCSPVVCSVHLRLAYASSVSGMLASTSRHEVHY